MENHELLEKILKKLQNLQNVQEEILRVQCSSGMFSKILSLFQPKLGRLYHHAPKPIEIPLDYYNKASLTEYPTISIVTPAFAHGNFIETTIKSVLEQEYPALEYVVKDGGSTDNTIDILKKYDSQLTYWESTKDTGQSQAINIGFAHTHGEIMAYLNSDDLLLPGTLHYVADYFQKHPEVDVIYGQRILINENDDEIGRWILPPHQNEILKWADYVPQETLFWRRSIWEKTGGKIDESFQFAMDWDLLLRFLDASANFVRLPRFLGAFRAHVNQKSSTEISVIGQKEMNFIRKRYHKKDIHMKDIKKHIAPYLRYHTLLHKLYRLGLLKY